jgi:hypothetical protein
MNYYDPDSTNGNTFFIKKTSRLGGIASPDVKKTSVVFNTKVNQNPLHKTFHNFNI